MRAGFTWCLSFPDGSCVVSLEGLPWNFFRNSTVVWDDYRQSPFLSIGTVFSSRTDYSPGPGWGICSWPLVFHISDLVRFEDNQPQALI